MKRHTFREFGEKRYAPNLFLGRRATGQFVWRENHRNRHPQEPKPSLPCWEQLERAEAMIEEGWTEE